MHARLYDSSECFSFITKKINRMFRMSTDKINGTTDKLDTSE